MENVFCNFEAMFSLLIDDVLLDTTAVVTNEVLDGGMDNIIGQTVLNTDGLSVYCRGFV